MNQVKRGPSDSMSVNKFGYQTAKCGKVEVRMMNAVVLMFLKHVYSLHVRSKLKIGFPPVSVIQ